MIIISKNKLVWFRINNEHVFKFFFWLNFCLVDNILGNKIFHLEQIDIYITFKEVSGELSLFAFLLSLWRALDFMFWRLFTLCDVMQHSCSTCSVFIFVKTYRCWCRKPSGMCVVYTLQHRNNYIDVHNMCVVRPREVQRTKALKSSYNLVNTKVAGPLTWRVKL